MARIKLLVSNRGSIFLNIIDKNSVPAGICFAEIPNIKQIPMTEIRKSKQRPCLKWFGHWVLEFVIYLEFGAWNL